MTQLAPTRPEQPLAPTQRPTLQAIPTAMAPALDDSPARDGWAGLAVLILFFGVFGGFAAFVPLNAAVHAVGEVSVVGHRQAVQHPEGGVVSRLLVHEDDHVKKDQVLLELSEMELAADASSLGSTVVSLQAQRARLLAERDGRGAVGQPPEFAALTGPSRDEAEQALTEQRRLFAERARARQGQQEVLDQRIAQLKEQQVGSERQKAAAKRQQELIDEEIAGVQQLVDKGLAPLTRLRGLERQRAELDGEIGAQAAAAARSQEAIGETVLQKSATQQAFKADVADQLRQTEQRLGEVAPRMVASQGRLQRAQVRAPATGRVVGLAVFTEGGVVAAGQTIMEIVPDVKDYAIDAKIDPRDADDIHPGMATEVRFSGLPSRRLPIISGEVTNVSADRMVDQRTGIPYYKVEVRVPQSELDRVIKAVGGDADRIRPGIPAEVVVPLRGRTMLEYLTEPLTGSLWRSFREH